MRFITTLTLIFIFFPTQISAQPNLPTKGDIATEVNFTPLSSSPFNISTIKLRYYTSDQIVFRLGFSMSGKTEKPIEDVKSKVFEFNIRPGIEKHFSTEKKNLSPYVGVELDYAKKTSMSEYEGLNGSFELDGAWDRNGRERGFTRYGTFAIAGFNYFPMKGLYFGVEFGYGIETITSADISGSLTGINLEKEEGGTIYQFGATINNAIRIGFTF